MSFPSINIRQPNTTSFQPIFQRGKTTSFATAPQPDDIEEIPLKLSSKKTNKNTSLPGIKGAFTDDFQNNKKDTEELSKLFQRASLNTAINDARREIDDRTTAAASNIMKINTNTLPEFKKPRYKLGGKGKTRKGKKNRRTRKSKKSRRRSTRRNKK